MEDDQLDFWLIGIWILIQEFILILFDITKQACMGESELATVSNPAYLMACIAPG